MAKAKPKEFRALTGFNYPKPDGEEGEEVRIDAGDKFSDIPEDVLKALRKGTEYEEWVERKTKNVRGDDYLGESTVSGVTSRHRDGQIVLKGVDENGTEPR